MTEATALDEAGPSLAVLFADLPRWARAAIGVAFVAECALLAVGLARDPGGEPGFVRIDLPSATPAPGFSTL